MGSTRSDGSATHKERLRWTQQLHDLFVEAVNRLGGPDSEFLPLIILCMITCLVQFVDFFLTCKVSLVDSHDLKTELDGSSS